MHKEQQGPHEELTSLEYDKANNGLAITTQDETGVYQVIGRIHPTVGVGVNVVVIPKTATGEMLKAEVTIRLEDVRLIINGEDATVSDLAALGGRSA